LTRISNPAQLKARYRTLAKQYHPDLGGDPKMFLRLNREYEFLMRRFELLSKGLEDVRCGDTIFVNGTECEVTFVGADIFIAKAKGRERKDVFYKKNGVGKYHPQFRASVLNHYPKKVIGN
jgi:hypothetical protein